MILVSSHSCLSPSHWSQVSIWEWRCSWSSADRRYIWVINNFIACSGATYIRGLTVLKMIKSLKPGKSPAHDGIQDKFLKLAGENLACSLCVLFNICIDSCIFHTSMKIADICPVYKKLYNLCKNNYRSINLLTIFSKLFERIMAEQLTTYFENILSPLLSANRRGSSCQHVILQLTEYWRRALGENKYVGTIAMDLSKAFDCMPHGLLLAKLHSCGLSSKACIFISNYLKNRLQRVKVMGAVSDWTETNRGVPQGSVLGPPLSNIFVNDLFFLPLDAFVVNMLTTTTFVMPMMLCMCFRNIWKPIPPKRWIGSIKTKPWRILISFRASYYHDAMSITSIRISVVALFLVASH